MKDRITKFLATWAIVILMGLQAAAQPMPPGSYGEDEHQKPASLEAGLLILLAMAGSYGVKKLFDDRQKFD